MLTLFRWLLQNETYLSWIRGDVPCLWISGDPGKGKTMLSIFLTEELERHTREVGAQLLFLFCSSQDEKRNKATAVLRCLVHQLITKRPDLFHHVSTHFEDENRNDTVSSPETLWIVLKKLLHAPALGRVFCVLDGLDECDDASSRLLATIFGDFFASKKTGSTTGNFQLAIVSRRIRGLDAFPQVRLDPDHVGHVDSDIQKFISDRVRELRKVDGFNDTLRNVVEKALLARSQGTFLWVGFVMAELCNKSTPTEIMATLKDLPSGLPAIYDRMLLRTDKSRRAVLTKALRWVTMAVRPLTLRELAAVTGVQPAVAGLSSYQSIRDLVTWCGPILKIHHDTVSLIHQSAKDYLLRQTPSDDPEIEEFRISAEEAHAELTRTCLACLERSGLEERSWHDFEIWGESDLEYMCRGQDCRILIPPPGPTRPTTESNQNLAPRPHFVPRPEALGTRCPDHEVDYS